MSGPQVRNALSDSQKEFLIKLNAERLTRVEHGLERNWVVQLVLAGVGLALVFDIGDLPRVLSIYLFRQEYDLRPVAVILLAFLLYYFMRLGRLLATFIDIKKLNDHLLDEYLGERRQDQELEALRANENFFEFYYAPEGFGRLLVVAYYVVSAITISTGQAAALYLMQKAYGLWALAAIPPAVIIMVLLYIGFWRSKRGHRGTTRILKACAVMTVLLYFVFAFCT